MEFCNYSDNVPVSDGVGCSHPKKTHRLMHGPNGRAASRWDASKAKMLSRSSTKHLAHGRSLTEVPQGRKGHNHGRLGKKMETRPLENEDRRPHLIDGCMSTRGESRGGGTNYLQPVVRAKVSEGHARILRAQSGAGATCDPFGRPAVPGDGGSVGPFSAATVGAGSLRGLVFVSLVDVFVLPRTILE